MTNVKAEQLRAEKTSQKFDFIVSRAVTAFPKFVALVRTKVKAKSKNTLPNGILYLKGGEFEDEIKLFKANATVFNLNEDFSEDFFETKRLIHLKIKNK